MPVIDITLLPGYAPEVQARLLQRVARATRSVIASAPAGTVVFVREASTYQRDGRVFQGGALRGPRPRAWCGISLNACRNATCPRRGPCSRRAS